MIKSELAKELRKSAAKMRAVWPQLAGFAEQFDEAAAALERLQEDKEKLEEQVAQSQRVADMIAKAIFAAADELRSIDADRAAAQETADG